MVDAILSAYPVAQGFIDRLGDVIAPDAIRLNVNELRRLPPIAMLRRLRAARIEKLAVIIDDESGAALQPVLTPLAGVVPARTICVVDPAMQVRNVTRLEIAGFAAGVAQASLAGALATARAQREVATLKVGPRQVVKSGSFREVLYLNANLWFGVKAGGSFGHISGVANAMMDSGLSVAYASAGGRLLVRPEIEHIVLDAPQRFGLPWETNYYRFHFMVNATLQSPLERMRAGFIYQRMSIANYNGVALSRKFRVPLVLEYNGSESWVARNWGRRLVQQDLADDVETVNLRHAHVVVTISDVLREELLSRGVEERRVVTYPNCIDPAMFDPARFDRRELDELRARYGIAPDSLVVTFIGTFGQWHGAEVLAEAVRQLVESHEPWVRDKKVRFMFVGDGLRLPEVRRILGAHAGGPYVKLAGLVPQKEAARYLAASDIVSSPHVPNADGSRFFGSPTKLFEYMAMGKAIVASDLDQIGQVLKNSLHVQSLPEGDASAGDDTRKLAVLCVPGSAAEHARGIRFLVDNPGWRRLLGDSARAEALARYTWRHHVEAILRGVNAC